MNIVPIKPKQARRSAQDPASAAAKVIAITSGKGGVGKTNVTSNLAIALARQGSRVCIFDADTSLANINVIMGVSPRYTVEHLLNGERGVDDILLEGPQGVMIVPAASGIAEVANLDGAQRRRLIDALEALEDSFDYLLIDTAAGIGESVLSFVQAAQYTILVISTEPTSLTDAFALLRVLKRQHHERPAHVLVNMALNYANSMEVFKRFEAAVRKYLAMKVHYLGYITEDKAIKTSVSQQRPVLLNDPDALASRCFTTLAAVLSKQFTASPQRHGFSAYWNGLATSLGEASGPRAGPLPQATSPETPAPAEELQGLATRARTLLAGGDVDAAAFEQLLGSLIELYVARFHRLPATEPGELSRLLGRTDHGEDELRAWAAILERHFQQRFDRPLHEAAPRADQEQQERVLREYREVVTRLEAEEVLLHQTLVRLYEYIDGELLGQQPRRAPPGEDSGSTA